MKKVFLFTCIAVAASCNHVDSVKKELTIPNAPASIDAVKAQIKNTTYEVDDVGTINLFNEFEWSSASKDTSKFYREYMAERKRFALQFVNDTIAEVYDENKNFEAKYILQNDTSNTILLNLKYADSSFSFNPGEPMMVTSSYKIKGVDTNGLLLETPREMNRRKIVLLMKKK